MSVMERPVRSSSLCEMMELRMLSSPVGQTLAGVLELSRRKRILSMQMILFVGTLECFF